MNVIFKGVVDHGDQAPQCSYGSTSSEITEVPMSSEVDESSSSTFEFMSSGRLVVNQLVVCSGRLLSILYDKNTLTT